MENALNTAPTAPTRPTAPFLPAPAGDTGERRRVIDDIRRMNPTASVAFLEGFGLMDLRDYVEHLRHARQKHVRLPGWVQRRSMRLAEARRELRKAS